jgi:hypothetical protein
MPRKNQPESVGLSATLAPELPVTREQSQSCQARGILPIGHLAVARDLFLREFGGDSLLGADVLSAFAS